MSKHLSEVTRRASIEALAIEVGESGTWWFARPTLRLRPIFPSSFGEEVQVGSRVGHSLAIERRKQRLTRAIDEGSDESQTDAFLELAEALLTEAHDVDPSTARSIVAQADWSSFTPMILSLVFPGMEHRNEV